MEFAGGREGDGADALDAEDAGEGDGGAGVAAAGEEFGAVETEGVDFDEGLRGGGDGDGVVGDELEDRGGAGLGAEDCFHGGGDGDLGLVGRGHDWFFVLSVFLGEEKGLGKTIRLYDMKFARLAV